MAPTQSFWPVAHREGDPDFWVCMSCLGEVYYRKVPMPDCPACHGVSTYEGFTLDAIKDWGTEELITKAASAQQDSLAVPRTPEAASSVEAVD